MASTRTRLIVAIPAAALLWAGVAGCSFSVGTSSDLDIAKAQDEIAKGIQEQTGVSVTVSCPSPVKIGSMPTTPWNRRPRPDVNYQDSAFSRNATARAMDTCPHVSD